MAAPSHGWRGALRGLRSALRSAPLAALQEASRELRGIQAELDVRIAQGLEETEMEGAIKHDLELQGYRVDAAESAQSLPSALPDDSALLAHEMSRKRRRLTGKTCTNPLPLQETQVEEEEGVCEGLGEDDKNSVEDAGLNEGGASDDAAHGHPSASEEEPVIAAAADEDESAPTGPQEEEEEEENETIFVSRKAFLELRRSSCQKEPVPGDSLRRLFDAGAIRDGEALVALDASQLPEIRPFAGKANVEALLALGVPEALQRIFGALVGAGSAGDLLEEEGEEEEVEQDACVEDAEEKRSCAPCSRRTPASAHGQGGCAVMPKCPRPGDITEDGTVMHVGDSTLKVIQLCQQPEFSYFGGFRGR